MDKDKLIEMAKNPDLIPGIYNYCDRWCERCAFTSHCLTFLTEEEKIKPWSFWFSLSVCADLSRTNSHRLAVSSVRGLTKKTSKDQKLEHD